MNNIKHRLAFIHDTFPDGGAENVTIRVSEYLLNENYEIHILCTEFRSSIFNIQSDNIHITLLPKDIFRNCNSTFVADYASEHKIEYIVMQVNALPNIDSIKSLCSAKIIYFNHGLPGCESYTYLEQKEKNIKNIFQYLEWHLINKFKYKIFKTHFKKTFKSYKRLYDSCDAYCVLCEGYGRLIAKKIGVDYNNSKFCVITNSTPKVNSAVNLKKEKIVVFCGRLTRTDKRVDRLLKIWSRIESRFPEWKLLIIGDGIDKENLEKYAKKLNLKNYSFEGRTNNVENYLQKAAILCLTSSFEGWPLVLTEAQSYGVVPIAFNCSQGVEQILSNGNGVLVKPFSINEYVSKLSALMQDGNQRTIFQKNIVQNCEQYHIENVIKGWKDMFNKVTTK